MSHVEQSDTHAEVEGQKLRPVVLGQRKEPQNIKQSFFLFSTTTTKRYAILRISLYFNPPDLDKTKRPDLDKTIFEGSKLPSNVGLFLSHAKNNCR